MVHHLVAAVLVEAGRILLGKRSRERTLYPGVWDVFGGHIEPNEPPEQALIRELQEELDITPARWEELETIQESIPGREDMPSFDVICRFYRVVSWNGTPVNRQPEEHSTIQWFSYEEAIRLELAHPAYPRLFAECLQRMADTEQ